MLLTYAILWEYAADTMYLLVNVGTGLVQPPPDFVDKIALYFHLEIAINLLNTCGIYAVKLSFMLFFKKLGHNVRGQKWLWWYVLLATVAGFAISIGVYDWPCLTSPVSVIISKSSSFSVVLQCLS